MLRVLRKFVDFFVLGAIFVWKNPAYKGTA